MFILNVQYTRKCELTRRSEFRRGFSRRVKVQAGHGARAKRIENTSYGLTEKDEISRVHNGGAYCHIRFLKRVKKYELKFNITNSIYSSHFPFKILRRTVQAQCHTHTHTH